MGGSSARRERGAMLCISALPPSTTHMRAVQRQREEGGRRVALDLVEVHAYARAPIASRSWVTAVQAVVSFAVLP